MPALAPSASLPMLDADAWLELDRADKVEMLARGQCLSSQRPFMEPSEDAPRRLAWGTGYQFGCSPLVQFCLDRRLDALADVLELGACPFAKDLEGDGLFELSLLGIARLDASQRASSPEALMLRMGWTAAQPLLDPNSPSFIGEPDASRIKFEIAMSAFSAGACAAARESGLPVEGRWIVDQIHTMPLLLSTALQFWHIGELRELLEAGLDFVSPLQFCSEDPAESLWLWVMDEGRDPIAVGELLLKAGNDPRIPGPNGRTPLEDMLEEPSAARTARHFRDRLRSEEEAGSIRDACLRAKAPSKKSAL